MYDHHMNCINGCVETLKKIEKDPHGIAALVKSSEYCLKQIIKENHHQQKHATKKKEDPKKAEVKKEEPKKEEVKKDEPKKEEPKKVEVKKDEPKKEEVKKEEPKK
jgi:hypothetical protein